MKSWQRAQSLGSSYILKVRQICSDAITSGSIASDIIYTRETVKMEHHLAAINFTIDGLFASCCHT